MCAVKCLERVTRAKGEWMLACVLCLSTLEPRRKGLTG
jgi:hypothetical protein